MTATRKTQGGGKSDLSTSSCAKDALTFVHFLRRELAAGRLPAQQKVYYGSGYSVRVQFIGTQRVTVGNEAVEADKITATIKGHPRSRPSSLRRMPAGPRSLSRYRCQWVNSAWSLPANLRLRPE